MDLHLFRASHRRALLQVDADGFVPREDQQTYWALLELFNFHGLVKPAGDGNWSLTKRGKIVVREFKRVGRDWRKKPGDY